MMISMLGCFLDISVLFTLVFLLRFHIRGSRLHFAFFYLLFWISDFAVSNIIEIPELLDLILFAVFSVLLTAACRISFKSALMLMVLYDAVASVTGVTVLLGEEALHIEFYGHYLISVLLSGTIRFLLVWFIASKLHPLIRILTENQWFILQKQLLLPSLLVCIVFNTYFYIETETYSLILVLTFLFSLLIGFSYLRQAELQVQLIINQQVQQIYNLTRIYQNTEKEIKKKQQFLIHDIKNHLIVLQHLADLNETEKIKSYLGSLIQGSGIFSSKQYCSCQELNAILNQKEDSHPEISFNFQILSIIPEALKQPVCIIAFNLLDNSIEECGKIMRKKTEVDFAVRRKSDFLIIECSNTNSRIHSTVSSKLNGHRGMGLNIIRMIADQNKGELIIHQDNFIFSVKVLLELTDKIL